MIIDENIIYWIAIAHLKKVKRARVRDFLDLLAQNQIGLKDFFENPDKYDNVLIDFNDILDAAKKDKADFVKYAFLAEKISDSGIEIINIFENEYPQKLKSYLKNSMPLLLYLKGNKNLLKEKSAAVVGSRNASEISLDFTKNISKRLSKAYKVIVSGYAKGVDRLALDSAMEVFGQSIMVLPQGILTIKTIIKNYEKQINNGDLLIVSTYYPSSPWSVAQAMERNSYIYGLSDVIYVAESGNSGGTWAGVISGLRSERKIYVRIPDASEKNANMKLIEKGAIGLDKDLKIKKINLDVLNKSLLKKESKPEDTSSQKQEGLF